MQLASERTIARFGIIEIERRMRKQLDRIKSDEVSDSQQLQWLKSWLHDQVIIMSDLASLNDATERLARDLELGPKLSLINNYIEYLRSISLNPVRAWAALQQDKLHTNIVFNSLTMEELEHIYNLAHDHAYEIGDFHGDEDKVRLALHELYELADRAENQYQIAKLVQESASGVIHQDNEDETHRD